MNVNVLVRRTKMHCVESKVIVVAVAAASVAAVVAVTRYVHRTHAGEHTVKMHWKCTKDKRNSLNDSELVSSTRTTKLYAKAKVPKLSYFGIFIVDANTSEITSGFSNNSLLQ